MKRLLLFFVLLLSLLASPAWAANWHPHTFVELQAQSNSASPGDTLWLDGSTSYLGTLTAKAGNTLSPVVYIGADLANPGSTTLTGLTPASHTRFYGIKITNSLNLGSRARVVIDHCDLVGSLDYQEADSCAVRSTLVRGTNLAVNYNGGSAGAIAAADTLEWCTFSGLSANGWYAILFGTTSPANYVQNFVRRFNTFTVTQSGSDAYSINKHFRTSNLLSYANKWVVNTTASGTGSGEGQYGLVYRDSSYNVTMKRDTVFINNGAGTLSGWYAYIQSSGMGGYNHSNTGVTIDSCYFRTVRGAAMYLGTGMPGLKIRNTILRSRMGTALELGAAFDNSSNDPYIHHNTIMGNQAVYFSDYGPSGGGFSNNILWGTSSASCDAYSAVGGTTGNVTSLSDSNLVYSTTADSSRALCKTACASPRTGAWSTTYSNDTHSSWASPAFTDTSWDALNVQPASSSLAFSNKWTLGYAGAQYTSTVPLAVSVSADVKSTTAGLVATLTGDVDTTATVTATLDGEATATWYRIPYTTTWATSLFGLTPGASATLVVTATRGAETATSTSTITARADNWWQQPIKGPIVWIAPLGNDTTGTGTYAAPYRSINKGWAVLKAKPNYGKGGAVGLQTGTYYGTGYLDGGEYATPDSMYHLVGEPGVIVSGVDENALAGLVWTATGINGVYKTRYLAADSVGTIIMGSHTLHKCTSRTEILTGTGTGAAGAWTYNAYSWYTNGTDSLYVRYNGSAPPAAAYIAIRSNLLSVFDKYIRITNIAFQYAGGGTGNGIAIKVGAGSAWNGTGAVIDSCSFAHTTREAIYAFDPAGVTCDSVVVADCGFQSYAYEMGYTATKGRLEESMTPIGSDGSGWMVTRNTITGWGGGIHHNGSGAWGSTLTNDWDICDNTISLTGDDAVEFDGAYARNTKFYRNTISGCNNAVSLAPIYGGPVFILYNQLRGYDYWGLTGGAFKLGTGDLGTSCGQALIANNTCFGDSLATAAYSIFDVGAFSHKHFLNNIFQSSGYCIYIGSASYVAGSTMDYNLYWRVGDVEALAYIDGANYFIEDLAALDLEAHGLRAAPAWADTGTTLRARSSVNRGTQIPGISGKIIPLVGAPDIGATEYNPPSVAASRRRQWLGVWLGLLKRAF